MIIIYGGSFNPPTIAHLEISKYLLNKYHPRLFIFLPVGNYYQKTDLAAFKHRFEMLRIMTSDLPNACVSSYENQLTFKGTIDTLNYFQSQYKDEDIFYVIGTDNLQTIDKWIDYKELLSKYKFIVLNRDSIDGKKMIESDSLLREYRESFIIETDFPKLPISSTLYREHNRDDVVLKEINEYIYKHNLYNRGGNV